MNKKLCFGLASATLLASMAAHAEEEMRCSHQLPPQHSIAGVIDQWATEVETLSDGEIDVQIYGANSLVGAGENIPSVAKGDIECAFSVNFQWGRTLPMMNVTVAPFAFSDMDVWRQWPTSEAANFLEGKLMEKGLKNVTWLFQTNTSVFTSNNRHLNTPESFEGVKIRGLVPAFDSGLAAMGAAPSAMSGGEVYQALSTGVIDAALTDIAAAYSRKYYEVQDYMTVVPVISVYFHGYVNPQWYDNLSEKSQEAITEAGLKAASWAIESSEEAIGNAPEQLEAEGVNLHWATEEEIEAMEAIMRPAYNQAFLDRAGDDAQTLIDLIGQLE